MVLPMDYNENYDDFFDIGDSDIEFDESAISAEPYFEYDNKRVSCSFTGHRIITDAEKAQLIPRLKSTILYLISLGVKEFHCGGALGFDTLAATVVFDVAREHEDISLILELPYEKQAIKWTDNEKRIYEFLKSKANEVNVHFPNPKDKNEAVQALLSRNRILIDKSHYCVCYHKNTYKGGTAYTVNYAKLHDVQIINLAEQL